MEFILVSLQNVKENISQIFLFLIKLPSYPVFLIYFGLRFKS